MLMTQTAVRTLQESRETDPVIFLDTLNRTIYKNVQRMNSEKSLTLVIPNYADGNISISRQHQETLVVRNGGQVERIETMDLGFPIGFDGEIADFISYGSFELEPGEGIVLYIDSIPKAKDLDKAMYNVQRMCEVISHNWYKSAPEIEEAVIAEVRRHTAYPRLMKHSEHGRAVSLRESIDRRVYFIKLQSAVSASKMSLMTSRC